MSLLSNLKELVLDLVFPPYCCHCRKIGQLLCANCYNQIIFTTLPIELRLEKSYLDQMIVAGQYQQPLKSVIVSLKYKSVKNAGVWLGNFLYYTTTFPPPDLIVAVPMHPKKIRARGFNQAKVIAQTLSQLTNTPFSPLLIKNKHTLAQASLNRSDRLSQLEDTFEFKGNFESLFCLLYAAQQKKLNILLVDDVVTTGSTLNKCARVLKKKASQLGIGIKITGLAVAHGA